MHLPWRDVAPGVGLPVISTSVTGGEAAELARLAAGTTVLEIGSAFGYSACVMALAGGSVTAVDPHLQMGSYSVMLGNLAACGVTDRVEMIREPSQAALPWLAAEGAQFGLIFIDGDHQAPAVRHDAQQALRLLAPGGTLAVHDLAETCCCPGVAQALGELFPGGPDGLTDTLAIYHPERITP
jgi:predicted O-methyltransferase YrrM